MKTDIEYEGILLDVEYDYYPAKKGAEDKYGLKTEPDQDEYVDLSYVSFQDQSGVDHELLEINFCSDSVLRYIEAQVLAEHSAEDEVEHARRLA